MLWTRPSPLKRPQVVCGGVATLSPGSRGDSRGKQSPVFGRPPCSIPSRQLCGLALSPAYWVLARVLSLPGQPVECLPPPGGQDTQARALQLAKLETEFRGRGTWVWAWPRQISVLQMWPPSVPLEQEGGSWWGCWGSLQAQLCPRPLYPQGPLFGAPGKPDGTPGLQNKDWTGAQFPTVPGPDH